MPSASARSTGTDFHDNALFASVVMPHIDAAYRLAQWLTGSPTDAEDVVQDAFRTIERNTMTGDANAEQDKARRFRDAALPYLDDVYALARYLMRGSADAEDAVQECYLRALRHFDSYRGPAMKPWLLAILRNVCNAEFARRGKQEIAMDYSEDEPAAEEVPMWQEPQASPEAVLLRSQDDATIRRLVAKLPPPFREAIVLREVNELSYREIAEVAGVPVGTVMSRLARARSMLRATWNVAEGAV